MDKFKTGNLIREARIKKNYTQSELGDLLGVSNKAVSRWENGDSFPDVAILEDLSSILDINIQNLITGKVEVRSKANLNDFMKAIIPQSKADKCKAIRNVLMLLILLFCIFSGYTALWKCHLIININSIFIYMTFMIISYFLLVLIIKSSSEAINGESDRVTKYIKLISFSSLLFCILFTWYLFLSSIKGYFPLGLELRSIGVFANGVLTIIYMINLIILVIAFWRLSKMNIIMFRSVIISIGCVYMSVLYGDMLYRLTTVEEVINSLIIRTIVGLISIVVMLIVSKIRND